MIGGDIIRYGNTRIRPGPVSFELSDLYSHRARTYPRGRPSIDLWDGRFM